jgi:hypothetical protein
MGGGKLKATSMIVPRAPSITCWASTLIRRDVLGSLFDERFFAYYEDLIGCRRGKPRLSPRHGSGGPPRHQVASTTGPGHPRRQYLLASGSVRCEVPAMLADH